MVLQSKPANRPTGIHGTTICILHVSLRVTHMNFLMRSQSAGLGERFTARLTDERLLPRMCPHVVHQAAGLGERLATRLTDVRLLSRMCPHVLSQCAGSCERLAARLTDMRLLPCVCAHVHGQFAW